MEFSYYLIYREGRRGGEILFNIGSAERSATLIRLGGARVRELFSGVLRALSRAGCVVPVQTGNPKVYSVRDDVGPVVGAYLVLVRRAQRVDYWLNFLDELLAGEHSRLGKVFSTLLEAMIDLSRGAPSGRGYSLSPKVVDAFSTALKTLVRSLISASPTTSTRNLV